MNKKIIISCIVILIIVAAAIKFWQVPKPPQNPQVETASTTPDVRVITIQRIKNGRGQEFDITLPKGYRVYTAASGMERIRFMDESPDGRLFLTDMHSLADNKSGKIYVLSNFNEQNKQYESKEIYLKNLRNPNSLAFYKDKQDIWWLYIALTDQLIRYKYIVGEMRPSSEPEIVASFPDYGLGYKYGGWHLTRTVAINNDKVYVSVGSSCNSCEEKEDVRATILEMDLTGAHQKIYARGLRNAVGIKWVDNNLYATNMGADQYGKDVPNDMFYNIKPGTNYGWPYCYVDHGEVKTDTSNWAKSFNCEWAPKPDALFKAHSAPLGLEYFDNFFTDRKLRDSFLVALHGSGNIEIGAGNSIVQVTKDGTVTDFITGFLKDGVRYIRPAGIFKKNNSSFFFSDDFTGVLYLVVKE